MKTILKAIFLFSMSVLVYSCSKDSDDVPQEPQTATNFEFSETTSKRAFDYYTANKILVDEIETNGAPQMPLDKTTLEEYARLVGLEGEIDETTANYIMNDVLDIQKTGLDTYLDRQGVHPFTKESLLDMSTKGPIKDIENDPLFRRIPKNEQDMLLGANEVSTSYFQNIRTGERVSDNLLLAVGGAVSGFSAGMAFCGPICGGIGAVLGGVVGWFSGNDK